MARGMSLFAHGSRGPCRGESLHALARGDVRQTMESWAVPCRTGGLEPG